MMFSLFDKMSIVSIISEHEAFVRNQLRNNSGKAKFIFYNCNCSLANRPQHIRKHVLRVSSCSESPSISTSNFLSIFSTNFVLKCAYRKLNVATFSKKYFLSLSVCQIYRGYSNFCHECICIRYQAFSGHETP